jgi:cytochrome c-type biogenesis protein CcmH/NrfG
VVQFESESVPAAPTELAPASEVTAPPAPLTSGWQRRPPRVLKPAGGRWLHALWWPTLLIAAIFCLITFYAKGGLNLESMVSTEMALTIGAGVLIAACLLLAAPGMRAYGAWPAGLLLAFTVLTAVSIVWSVQPDHSWQDSGRMLAYTGVFTAGVALVRVVPGRWPAVLGGLTLAAVVVCAYALATKAFPSLDPLNTFARLNEPYGYWNAVGLTAAMGVICCLWLGSRRTGHALARAFAYPAMGLLLLTLVLAYSRGALAALALGLLLWFCIVPLRLRAAALLIVAALGAGAVVAWDFSRHALSSEGVPLAERAQAGHQLGALIVTMLVALTIVGIAIGFTTARRAPSLIARRRAGALLLAMVVLVLVAFAGALAHSQRGFTGSISHAVSALTDPDAKQPPNTAARLTAVASVRARYWKEALQVFQAHPTLGAGAEGYWTAHLRYETETLEVRHAHGFIVQTLADLGLVGLMIALALLLTWMAAAGRATHPFNRRWTSWRAWLEIRGGERPGWRALQERALTRYTPERVGMLCMLCVVVVFGAHSLIDWTWYVPGDACVALLCAGWLAGRGELLRRPRMAGVPDTATGAEQTRTPGATGWRLGSGQRPSYTSALMAGAVVVLALLAAWSQWQPQRSEDARSQADAQLEANNVRAATAAARAAVSRDPLSVEALFALANVQQHSGHPALAQATLERAVRLQPSNPQTWLVLGRNDLVTGRPQQAVKELQAAIYLDPQLISMEAVTAGRPEAIEVHNDYIQALQAAQRREAAASAAAAAARAARIKSASARHARAAAGGHRAGHPRSVR